MLAIPAPVGKLDVVFGNAAHMPQDVPPRFLDPTNVHVRAVTAWYNRGQFIPIEWGLIINGCALYARHGVSVGPAIAALRSVMSAREPEPQAKMAACAYMLSEWFEFADAAEAA